MKIDTDKEEDEVHELINLTPLLDIVFNLLIFFMVTTQFLEDEKDLKIKLPDAENAEAGAQKVETMVVNIRKDGSFLVAERVMDRDELKKHLAAAKRRNADQKVVLRADRDVPFRHPVAVMDICKGLGVETSLAAFDGRGEK